MNPYLSLQLGTLTEKQGEVVCALIRGYTVEQVASRLNISTQRVYQHMDSINTRLEMDLSGARQRDKQVQWLLENVRPLDDAGQSWPGWFPPTQEVTQEVEPEPTQVETPSILDPPPPAPLVVATPQPEPTSQYRQWQQAKGSFWRSVWYFVRYGSNRRSWWVIYSILFVLAIVIVRIIHYTVEGGQCPGACIFPTDWIPGWIPF